MDQVGSIQTSLGTFVASYLADLGWSKENIGLALATGQMAGVIGQIPGGAVTDAIPWKRGFAAIGILMSMGAALILATAPLFALVFCLVLEQPVDVALLLHRTFERPVHLATVTLEECMMVEAHKPMTERTIMRRPKFPPGTAEPAER